MTKVVIETVVKIKKIDFSFLFEMTKVRLLRPLRGVYPEASKGSGFLAMTFLVASV